MGEKATESEMEECESLRQCGRGSKESESGWRLWIADVAHWGFGRGHMSLNPAPAGWHRGEREVTAPQRTAHKTLSSGRDERETRPLNPALQGRRNEQITLRV